MMKGGGEKVCTSTHYTVLVTLQNLLLILLIQATVYLTAANQPRQYHFLFALPTADLTKSTESETHVEVRTDAAQQKTSAKLQYREKRNGKKSGNKKEKRRNKRLSPVSILWGDKAISKFSLKLNSPHQKFLK